MSQRANVPHVDIHIPKKTEVKKSFQSNGNESMKKKMKRLRVTQRRVTPQSPTQRRLAFEAVTDVAPPPVRTFSYTALATLTSPAFTDSP